MGGAVAGMSGPIRYYESVMQIYATTARKNHKRYDYRVRKDKAISTPHGLKGLNIRTSLQPREKWMALLKSVSKRAEA